MGAVRKNVDGDDPFDRSLWQKIVEMGWTATTIPEEYGGLGLTYLELCVIAEELGRVVAPVPFSSSVYLATEALVRAGARVLIASRKGADCEAVAEELNELKASGTAEGFAGDVGSEDGILAIVDEVKTRTDRLHILVNNSAATWAERYESFPHTQWQRVMDVNVAAPFTLTREFTPMLSASGTADNPARVINLASVMGVQPIADSAYSYSASKAAVVHLTKILADELASRSITVSAFAPGPFPSRMTAYATNTDEKVAKLSSGVPAGRLGRPEDIARATLFLCGRGGAYTTGAIIPIDGGQSVQHGMKLGDKGN